MLLNSSTRDSDFFVYPTTIAPSPTIADVIGQTTNWLREITDVRSWTNNQFKSVQTRSEQACPVCRVTSCQNIFRRHGGDQFLEVFCLRSTWHLFQSSSVDRCGVWHWWLLCLDCRESPLSQWHFSRSPKESGFYSARRGPRWISAAEWPWGWSRDSTGWSTPVPADNGRQCSSESRSMSFDSAQTRPTTCIKRSLSITSTSAPSRLESAKLLRCMLLNGGEQESIQWTKVSYFSWSCAQLLCLSASGRSWVSTLSVMATLSLKLWTQKKVSKTCQTVLRESSATQNVRVFTLFLFFMLCRILAKSILPPKMTIFLDRPRSLLDKKLYA